MKQSLLFLSLISITVSAQEMDYKYHLNYQQKQEISLNFENDFFLATDRYYSQGIALAYKRPVSNPARYINKLYIGTGNHSLGFGFDQMCFTPRSIAYDSILSDDRPFAATMRFNTMFETTDSTRSSAYSWSISVGIIGKEAQGRETQTGIHRATNNPIPRGWQYQIGTGLLFDMNAYGQQQLLGLGRWFILVIEESAWLGTSRINATLGSRLQLQYLSNNRKIALGGFANPAITIIGYDGTLQGSLLGEKSIYAVNSERVKHIIFEREFGAFVRIRNIELNGTVNIFTNNFKGGNIQRWGGLKAKVYF